MNRKFFLATAFVIGAVATNGAAAQAPTIDRSKLVRFINPLGPGSGADTVTRMVADQYGKLTGQTTFAENRPGADSIIAVQSLLSSPPDGKTIMLMTPSAVVINPLTKKNLPYDPKSIRPIAWATKTFSALVVGEKSRYQTLEEVISAAKKSPESLTFANYALHYQLGALSIEKLAGVKFTHVSYKGGQQANTDVVGGIVDLNLTDISGALPLIRAGRLKPLAVASDKRHPLIPDVPTFEEAGIPGFQQYVWTGFGIRADTPEHVAAEVEENILKALRSKEFVDFQAKQWGTHIVAVGADGKTLQKNIAEEIERYRDIAALLPQH